MINNVPIPQRKLSFTTPLRTSSKGISVDRHATHTIYNIKNDMALAHQQLSKIQETSDNADDIHSINTIVAKAVGLGFHLDAKLSSNVKLKSTNTKNEYPKQAIFDMSVLFSEGVYDLTALLIYLSYHHV